MASSMAAKFSQTSTGSKSRNVRRSVKMPSPRRDWHGSLASVSRSDAFAASRRLTVLPPLVTSRVFMLVVMSTTASTS